MPKMGRFELAQHFRELADNAPRASSRVALRKEADMIEKLAVDVSMRDATLAAFAERNAQREESRRADR